MSVVSRRAVSGARSALENGLRGGRNLAHRSSAPAVAHQTSLPFSHLPSQSPFTSPFFSHPLSTLTRSRSQSSPISIPHACFHSCPTCSFSSAPTAPQDDAPIPPSKLEGKSMIGFTCKVCSTRSYHMISKQAYAKGVVIINCPGCKKNHLIADHLGWYDSIKTVGTLEDMMAAAGRSDEVRRVTVGVVPGGESWSVGSHKRRRTRQSHEGTGTEGGLMDGDGLVAKEGSRTEVEQTSDPSHDTDTDAESAHMQALQGAVFHKSMSGTLELLPEDVLEHERQLIAKAAQSKAARDADAAKAA